MTKSVSLKEIATKIKALDSVAIFCHIRPDGDALGSLSALSYALDSLGIKNSLFCDDVVPDKFFFIGKTKTIKNEIDGSYDAMIAVDSAEESRLGSFAEHFLKCKNTFNIDHHVSNTRFASFNYVHDSASNAENIYDLVCELGVNLSCELAECLLLGIVTDTGNFKHKNVTASTLFTAGKLVEAKADLNKIVYSIFTSQTKERALLFGRTMSKIRYFLDDRFAVASVSLKDIEDCGAKRSDTEGFIDFVMGICSVEVGACVMETEKNKYKISFRSKSANVNEIASQFGGGGHVLASGCQIQGEYEEVVDKIRFQVSRYLPD